MSQNNELLPCPFCGGGATEIRKQRGTWTGQGYGEPISVSVLHWCEATPGQPSRAIERIGRDHASAIAAWNTRAALAAQAVQSEPVAWCNGDALLSFKCGNEFPLKLSETKGGFYKTPLYAHPAPLQLPDQVDKLLTIIASAYQIAGAHDAPEHILDVLSDPENATEEQINTMLPYRPAQAGQPHDLQQRLAELHQYEEIAEHYAKCAISPEALRDWVVAAQAGQTAPVAWTDANNIEFLKRYKNGGVVFFCDQEHAGQVPIYHHPAPVGQHQANWYCIDKSGMATLCTDKDDALQNAKLAQEMWPHNGHHRAVQLFEHPPALVRQPLTKGDVDFLVNQCRQSGDDSTYALARAIEAKINEKGGA